MLNSPKLMWLLGYAGVIPFLVLSVYVAQDKSLFFNTAIPLSLWLGIYAAVILSFLGAVSWGVALSRQSELSQQQINLLLVYGVLPSLFAWFSLLFPIKLALAIIAGLIVMAYVADLKMLSSRVSSQYLRLRFHLSISVATLLLISSFFA